MRGSPGQATRLYDLPKPRALPLHAFCPPLPLIGGGANIYKSPVFVKARPNRLAILICLHVSHYFETSRVCVIILPGDTNTAPETFSKFAS